MEFSLSLSYWLELVVFSFHQVFSAVERCRSEIFSHVCPFSMTQSLFAHYLIRICSCLYHLTNYQVESMYFSFNSMYWEDNFAFCKLCPVTIKMLNLWQKFEIDTDSQYLSIKVESKKICCSGMPALCIGCRICYIFLKTSVTQELYFINGRKQESCQLVWNGRNKN